MKKKDPTSHCGCHSEKSLGYPLDFYQKVINFRGVTQSSRITFGAAEPNSISAKGNADKKETLGNVHPQKKIMDI